MRINNNHNIRGHMKNNSTILALRVVFWVSIFVASSLGAQTVSNVDFQFNTSKKVIEIGYTLGGWSDEQAYNVSLEFSQNGGTTFAPIKSATGDVGIIQGRGQKNVVWNVFNDYDEVDGNIVIKVIYQETKTAGQAIANTISAMFLGSDATVANNDGFEMYYGYFSHKFSESSVSSAIDKGFSNKGFSFTAGAKLFLFPVVIDGNYFSQKYTLKNKVTSDSVSDAGLSGFEFSAAYTILPVIPWFVPYIGAGMQFSTFYVGESAGDKAIEQRETSSPFLIIGGQLSLASWFKITANYKKSLSSEIQKEWSQFSATAALRF